MKKEKKKKKNQNKTEHALRMNSAGKTHGLFINGSCKLFVCLLKFLIAGWIDSTDSIDGWVGGWMDGRVGVDGWGGWMGCCCCWLVA